MLRHSTIGLKQRLKICGRALVYPYLAVALGLLSPCAWATYNVHIDAPEAPRALKKLLKTHLDVMRFAKNKDISDEQFEFLVLAAPRQARELVKTSGYFSAEVKTEVTTAANGKKAVTLHISPGPRTIVHDVSLYFTGPVRSEALKREKAARTDWSLLTGGPFTQQGWEDAKNASLNALQAERYLGAEIVSSQACIDPEAHQAAVSATFDSGPTFTLGPLEISGLQRYPEFIIHHVNPLTIGEVYREARILELQRQVQNTGYFANVAIEVENDRNKAHHAPVRMQVSEYPLHAIRAGIGYSSDTGARVQSQYLYHNVFGRAWIFDARAALEQRKQYAALQLSMPPDRRAFVNSALGSYERTRAANTDTRSLRAGVQRTRTLQNYDHIYSILYYHDHFKQNAGAPETSRALVPSWGWKRRNVDDQMFPRRGNLISVWAGFAVKGILTDRSFIRTLVQGHQYIPLSARDLLLLRAEFGSVFTHGDSTRGIPASLLFRAGGSDSIRGYGYQSIGNEVNGSVLPTRYLLTGSAEYQHWFNRDWGAALFYDTGAATNHWSQRALYSGIGAGARWRSPVGPVNLDLAYGLKTRSFRPYLTLGIAF